METRDEKRKEEEATAIVCAVGMVVIVVLVAMGGIVCKVPQLILERLAWIGYAP